MGPRVDLKAAYAEYYKCGLCKANIASEEDFQFIHIFDEAFGGIFTKAMNLSVDIPERHRRIGDDRVANCYCIVCHNYLGWKYIEVRQQRAIQNNMVKLFLHRLSKKIPGPILKPYDDNGPVNYYHHYHHRNLPPPPVSPPQTPPPPPPPTPEEEY